MDKSIALLVNSCDKYSTAWQPFFELLNIYWERHPAKVYLNTEGKDFSIPEINITVIKTYKSLTWSERLIRVLNEIDAEYIFFSLEDFFLRGKVNNRLVEKYLDLMVSDRSIGAIRLSSHDCFVLENYPYYFETLKECPIGIDYRVDTQMTLWRKSVLLSLIDKNETPWEFENNAPKRADKTDYKFLWHYQDTPNDINTMIFPYTVTQTEGYGIAWGHWLWKNRKWFECNGLSEISYSILGTLSEREVNKRYKYLYNKDADRRSFTAKMLTLRIYLTTYLHNVRSLGWRSGTGIIFKKIIKRLKKK